MKDFLDELDNELNGVLEETPIEEKKSNPLPKTNKNTNNRSVIIKKEETETQQKQPTNNNQKNNTQNTGNITGYLNKKSLNFPQTKFYLPTLRDGYTRFIPIGGNNETGAKNMGMVQYGDDIVLIDCGVQFAETDMFGANYSVPDVSFLTRYKKQIKGFIITHAHLDHIGSLKHVLPALGMPPLYGTKLTIGLIKKSLEEYNLLEKATLIEVEAGKGIKEKIGPLEVEFFKVNHSIPDSSGVYIKSPGGAKFVHTGDFKIDFTPAIDAPADLTRIKKIGDEGISLLLSDSTGSIRKGFCKSEKDIGESLEKIVANHTKGRLIIAAFSSWISRVQQLVDICNKHDRQIFLSGRSMIENVNIARNLGYLKVKSGIIKKMTPKTTQGIPPHKQVIITTGSQGEEFSALARMSEGKHNSIEIVKGDTIVFSSSVVPGNEKSVGGLLNKLVKLGANIITKDDGEVHTGGHAFQEEQKIMLKLVRPKYFMPIYGDLYFRHVHKNTAMSIGFKEENVLMLGNGNIVDFAPDGAVFKSRIKVPIQDLIVDGHGMGTATSHVLKAREKMMNSGVLVILFRIDKKTKAILGHLKLETRGLVYLEEVRYVHKIIIKKAKESYENTIKDIPDIEEKDLIKVIKTDMETFLLKRIDREPMIIPMILEV